MRSAAATFLTSAEGQSHMLAFWSERADTKAAAAKGHKYKGGLKLSDIL
jgi:hypothetical protein